jgi:4-diphosphocytidyl-2-C-methyl-D-erythritol kinase
LPTVELTARAKLTLTLRVMGVRSDGYHLLECEMVTLDLADSLLVGDGDSLAIVTEPPLAAISPVHDDTRLQSDAALSGPDNLVSRALEATGRSARVELVKRIPPGAGLGGGSADAAALLRWAGRLDASLAAGLGADVPFCIQGGRAMVRGIGEEITPLPFEERNFVLLLLPFGVATGAVYREWDELARCGALPAPAAASNDLEEAALRVEPRLGPWRDVLAEASGQRPRLAGSGSTWFIEGDPDQSGLRGRQWLHQGDERALLVPVTTTPPLHQK